MIEIRNLTFQPLAYHLAGGEGSIHLGSRERKPVREDQVSDEMRTAAARGFISLTEAAESTQPDPRGETSDAEHDSAPQTRQKRRRER